MKRLICLLVMIGVILGNVQGIAAVGETDPAVPWLDLSLEVDCFMPEMLGYDVEVEFEKENVHRRFKLYAINEYQDHVQLRPGTYNVTVTVVGDEIDEYDTTVTPQTFEQKEGESNSFVVKLKCNHEEERAEEKAEEEKKVVEEKEKVEKEKTSSLFRTFLIYGGIFVLLGIIYVMIKLKQR